MTTTDLNVETLLQAVRDMEPLLREHAPEAEHERRLSAPVVDAMVEAQLFRMWIPRGLDGLEFDLLSGFRVVQEVARIDSAAGWNLNIAAGAVLFGGFFPDDVAAEIFKEPRAILAGSLDPTGGQGLAIDGGFQVSGRWAFGSGCHQATRLVAPSSNSS